MGTVCVEVAVLDDRRLLDALASLETQQRRPDQVFVAASPATPQELLDEARRRFPSLPIAWGRFPGGIVDARAGSLTQIGESVTAFLDADERAPPEWLARLIAPIENGGADFSGGPTRPLRPPTGSIERYMVLLEESIYSDLVPRRVTYLPLQNTAWRTDALRRFGFDARIPFAEDHDLETRAARAGLVGAFVPDAWVYHDKTEETSLPRWARKRYRYLVALAMSMMKNGELRSRLSERRRPVRHPLRY
ncbi:MAG: glycosyltransferase, partial [Candidatus Lutacidiplasmatales archaeon]